MDVHGDEACPHRFWPPPTQAPLSQASLMVQNWPSSHGVPGSDGNVTITRPDGTIIDPSPAVGGDGAAIVVENQRLELEITAETTRSLSNGERYDRGLASDALWCLLRREFMRPKALNVPAETAA